MSDLDITIKLDPTQASAGASKVKSSVSDLEKQTEKTRQSMSALSATMIGLPYNQASTGLQRIADGATKLGFNVKNASEKLREMGKTMSFGLVMQGFEKANEALKEFDLSLGNTGAAIGFQLGGPLGMVAGTIGEIVGTKLGGWLSESDRAARDAAAGYMLAVQQMDAFAAGVEKAELAHSRLMREMQEADPLIGGTTRILNQQADAWQNAATKVLAYGNALAQLQVGKIRSGNSRTTVDDVVVSRGLRDAQLDLQATTQSYGAVVLDIIGKENKRKDSIEDARAALAAGAITQQQYNDYMKQFADRADAATIALRKLIEEERKLRNSTTTIDTRVNVTSGIKPAPYKQDDAITVAINRTAPGSNVDMFDVEDAERGMAAARKEAERYQATVDDLANNSMASLQQASEALGDALVDAFMDGNLEAGKLLDTLGRMLLKGAISNLIGFGFAQLQPAATGLDAMVGVPRFASGGDAMVRGAGGTDSRLAMLAVTPGESIHVRTPEQRAEMARSGGRGGVKIVNQMPGRRELLQSFDGDSDFDQVVLNVFQRHAGAVRSLGR